jgi:hypothetical protein
VSRDGKKSDVLGGCGPSESVPWMPGGWRAAWKEPVPPAHSFLVNKCGDSVKRRVL